MAHQDDVQDYLRRLGQCLNALPADQRDDILAELGSHFEEARASGRTDVLRGFDAPEDYAGQFLAETELRGALARGTSLALGRSLLVGARNTLVVLFAVVPLGFLHVLGVIFVGLGVLKPFFPAQIGAFSDAKGGFAIGFFSGTESMHEHLGFSAVPLFCIGGILVFWLANRALRWLAHRRLASLRLAA